MEIWERLLTKDEISTRFIWAVNAVLSNNLIPNKSALAESLRVKPSKFSEILNGRMKVGIDMIAIMCDFYNISPDWILMSRGNNLFRTSELPAYCVDDEKWIKKISPSEPKKEIENQDSSFAPLLKLISEKDITIREQAEEIGQLKEQVRQLTIEKERLAASAHSSATANAG
jgi:plasmid maintenance system antidote protein VapI